MRVVLDANVIIAAFAARGLCQAVFETCLDNHELVLSDPLFQEITRNLKRKPNVPAETISEIERFLESHATIVDPAVVDAETCEDKKDLMVLGTALAGRASYLVTGDRGLLKVKQYGGFSVLSPRAFWERMRKRPPRAL